MAKEAARKTTLAVYTKNKYLFQKILLSLPEGCTANMISDEGAATNFDLVLWDKETSECPYPTPVTLGRGDDCDIKVPFSIDAIGELLSGGGRALTVYPEKKSASFFSKSIKFTDVEFALLTLLINGGGEFISREEILESVWHGESDSGVINVYIHYLREKLEWCGEKVILSSRKLGYAIDKRFLEAKNTRKENPDA